MRLVVRDPLNDRGAGPFLVLYHPGLNKLGVSISDWGIVLIQEDVVVYNRGNIETVAIDSFMDLTNEWYCIGKF